LAEGRLFELENGGEVEVRLTVRREGQRFELTHNFRRPTVADKKEFWSELGAAAEGGQERNKAYLSAQERLYDKCVVSVDGYELGTGDGDQQNWWVEGIPLEHKLWAVEKLLAAAGNLDSEAAKN